MNIITLKVLTFFLLQNQPFADALISFATSQISAHTGYVFNSNDIQNWRSPKFFQNILLCVICDISVNTNANVSHLTQKNTSLFDQCSFVEFKYESHSQYESTFCLPKKIKYLFSLVTLCIHLLISDKSTGKSNL